MSNFSEYAQPEITREDRYYESKNKVTFGSGEDSPAYVTVNGVKYCASDIGDGTYPVQKLGDDPYNWEMVEVFNTYEEAVDYLKNI